MGQLDPRAPVIIGVGQVLERNGGFDPITLIARAVDIAATDTGVAGLDLAGRIDTIGTAAIVSWRYTDAGRAVGEAIRSPHTVTISPDNGGNTPQMLMNRIGDRIRSGQSDLALVSGGEAYRTRMRARRDGTHLTWAKQDRSLRPSLASEPFEMAHAAELALGILLPTQCYPMFDQALRHQRGVHEPEWRDHLGKLWAGFSEVATQNPDAWDREPHSAAEIATVTATNRLIGSPYTKLMVSNPDVDMASAVLVCSVERAEALGVLRDRWVFLHAGADANDPFMSERPSLVASGAIRHAGGAALELAGVGIDDVAHLDVYSCFPSAVQIACAELGIGLDRTLTTTGGLCFGGGPWNNPVGHSIASMVDTLRRDPGTYGLVTANGGILQKHSFGVYGTTPPAHGFRTAQPQSAVDSEPRVAVHQDYLGPAALEGWSVMHERDGSPSRVHATLRTPDGGRCWAASNHPDVIAAMSTDDVGEASATVGPNAELLL